ncbi:hypothetical protein QX776_03220 [Alteromonadaceae bacterium BrNp21-10]|nr:hypothetical protein [Alteromonadaceae bacterium BrNp21-10]
MMGDNFHSHVINSGVSETLLALFEGLRETPGIYTDYKYRKEDVNRVAQYLVCRNYGKACLELSYMCWGIINYEQHQNIKSPLLTFFWVQESITPVRLKVAFSQNNSSSPQVILTSNSLVLQLDKPFEIALSRVGVLATLLEFIVTVDPALISYIESTLKNGDEADIKNVSSELQKHIYQFLSAHIDAAQTQRRYRYVASWMEQQGAASHKLNDDSVLAFWHDASMDENSPGHKLYATALLDIMATDQALIQAQLLFEAQHGASIGYDHDLGELSPDVIQQSIFDQQDSQRELNYLADSPKCLTKQQWELVQPLMRGQHYLKKLPWSFIRLGVMGQWQAKLVQAKRQSIDVVQQKLQEPLECSYQDYLQSLQQQPLLYRSVLLAIAHVLYNLQDPRFMGIVLSLLPKETATELKNAVIDGAKPRSQALFNVAQQACEQLTQSRELLIQATAAFKANNKQGFKSLPEIHDLESYQQGAEGLQSCQKVIKSFLNGFAVAGDNIINENYVSDVFIFKQVFEQLYLSNPIDE